MEEMARVLGAVAGDLQQSFGAVFERVGRNLEQSAQMMDLMNAMMESALLQQLDVRHRLATPQNLVTATIVNRSPIVIAEAQLRIRGLGAGDDANEAIVLELPPLEARSEHEIETPISAVRAIAVADGALELAVRSPGTRQWLSKSFPWRIALAQLATIHVETAPIDGVSALRHPQYHRIETDAVLIPRLRDWLHISPFDALVTAESGHYRLASSVAEVPEVRIAVQRRSDAATEATTIIAVRIPEANEQRQRAIELCERIHRQLTAE